jgi:hypothetical protein
MLHQADVPASGNAGLRVAGLRSISRRRSDRGGIDRCPACPEVLAEIDLQYSPDGASELCPELCPNGFLPSTNTVSYRETRSDTSRMLSR